VVAIESLETPSRLRENLGTIGDADFRELRSTGAVGDICKRFFDEVGGSVTSPLGDRVLAIGVEQHQETPRTVALAGGRRKFTAIRAALRGRWVDTLITDLDVAQLLVADS
jgi:DNA-binding transcriptional regulator LsrR (DeoR family)